MPVQVMPDDHSKLVPPLPIPNRTVKQLCADDSAATSVKVGYRQACYLVQQPPAVPPGEKPVKQLAGFFSSGGLEGFTAYRRKKSSAARCLFICATPSEMVGHFQVQEVDACIRLFVATIREMLDLGSDFPIIVEDIADADVVAELEVGRQAVIVIIIQLLQHVHANAAFGIQTFMADIFKTKHWCETDINHTLCCAGNIAVAIATPCAKAGIPVTAQLRAVGFEPGFIPVRSGTHTYHLRAGAICVFGVGGINQFAVRSEYRLHRGQGGNAGDGFEEILLEEHRGFHRKIGR